MTLLLRETLIYSPEIPSPLAGEGEHQGIIAMVNKSAFL
jgi:hypothetical protein